MFHLTSLRNSTHWENNLKTLTALTADNKFYISCVTGATDYLAVSLSPHSKDKSRVLILSISHPETSLEDATLLLYTSSPILFSSTLNSTGLLVQQDGSLVLFGVKEGLPQLVTYINILSNPDNIVTNLCVSYALDYLIWTEERQKEGRYNSVLCSLSLLALQEGQLGRREVVCSCCPKVEISVSDTILLMLPKEKLLCGLIFLYPLKRKLFKIVNLCEVANSNLQPWKNDLSVKHFMFQQSSLGAKNDTTALLVAAPTGSLKTSFYILDMNSVLWRLIIDERELLFREKVCSIDIPPFVSDEVLQMTSFQQLIFILKGNNLRIYELTQGVCVQSDIQPEGEFYIYTYLFHKYKKLAISTQTNVFLIENLPLKDQVSHLHASIPEESRLATLVRTPDLLKPWNNNSMQIKSILDAAYWIIKQMSSDCIESTHRDELESLFTQLNHERIDNPIILFNLFSRFPKFQTDLHRELNYYDNSLKDMKQLRNNIIPFYYKGEFAKNISTLPSLITEQDNIMIKRNTVQTASSANKIQTQVFAYINSVVNESVTHGICTGYSYKFEYLCLVNPEEVLQSIKYYFSQDHRHNPNEKINWKKLFNSVEPVPSTIKDGREILPSIFETVCRLVFQYDPEYLIPFINKCQHLLDVDCSKEPAFMRKSSHAQTYQRALESLPNLSYLLSGNQDLTTSKAITYYKVLNSSKTLNSGNKCIQILAAVSEWKTALNVLQQYTQNDYLHFYLFTTLSYLMNKAGVLSNFSEELYLMRPKNYSVGQMLQMFNQLSNYHPDNPSYEGDNNVAPFLKILLREDVVQ